jgi:Flp pilus assembly protein TadD
MRSAATTISFCAALFFFAPVPISYADPYEDNPDAALRDPEYGAAIQAINRKDWAEAVKRLHQVELRAPDSADLHNYLGYSYRNLKKMDLAFKHYKRSLELNPRHRGAHEYIGEAYLLVNDLPSAEKHVNELRNICLLACDELADLEKAVAAYKSKPK